MALYCTELETGKSTVLFHKNVIKKNIIKAEERVIKNIMIALVPVFAGDHSLNTKFLEISQIIANYIRLI